MALEETPRECLTKHCWKTNASYTFLFSKRRAFIDGAKKAPRGTLLGTGTC